MESSVPINVSPETFGQTIVELVQKIGMPIGGAVLFLSICFVAIKIMTSAFNPDKKISAWEGLYQVAIGGIILGGALFLAGFFLGIGDQLR